MLRVLLVSILCVDTYCFQTFLFSPLTSYLFHIYNSKIFRSLLQQKTSNFAPFLVPLRLRIQLFLVLLVGAQLLNWGIRHRLHGLIVSLLSPPCNQPIVDLRSILFFNAWFKILKYASFHCSEFNVPSCCKGKNIGLQFIFCFPYFHLSSLIICFSSDGFCSKIIPICSRSSHDTSVEVSSLKLPCVLTCFDTDFGLYYM